MPLNRFTRGALLGAFALASPVARVRAQILSVIVRDSVRDAPLGDVLVSLLDRDAALVSARRTSDKGRIVFSLEGAGHYAVMVQRPGFRQIVSNWIAVGSSDTLEVTFRVAPTAVVLSPVLITAQIDSVTPLLPPGINPRAIAGRVIVPAEIDAHAMGARDYVDVLSSIGVAGLAITYWKDGTSQTEHHCLASTRSVSRRACLLVFVNNMRVGPEQAMDLATPENLDFAVWLRPEDAGVLYGAGTPDGVLLLFTKDWRRARSAKPPP